jgi:hypothetical protein
LSTIHGQAFKITDLAGFAKNPLDPDPKTFVPFAGLTLVLTLDFPAGFSGQFPAVTINGTADAQGRFTIDLGNFSSLPNQGFLLAFDTLGTFEEPFTHRKLPILAPVYRSSAFKLKAVTPDLQKIFIAPEKAPAGLGITQDQVDSQIDAVVKSLKQKGAPIDTLSAFINDGMIHVFGTGHGAKFTFDINIKAATGNDLSQFMTDDVENFNIDLPGPDVITTIFVDEDHILQQIKEGVAGLVGTLNAQIRAAFIQEIHQLVPGANATDLFDHRISTTFEKVLFPVLSQHKVGTITVKRRAITGDPAFGLPRDLYA